MVHFFSGRCAKFSGIFLLFAITLLDSCRDFIEDDLSGDVVNVLAPQDNLVTTTATLNFYWDPLEGALQYHLQIVKPGFANPSVFLVDTVITKTKFAWTFTPGTYQWRVRAENGSSESMYSTRSFQVDSTLDLSQQQIILIAPAQDLADSSGSFTFNWYGLYNATQYTWTLKSYTGAFIGSTTMPAQTVTDTFLSVANIPEGRYDWGIRAENGFSVSNYSFRSVWVDMTAPGSPTPLSPANGYNYLSANFSLSWARATDNGSTLKDSLLIFSDSLYTNVVRSVYTSGTSFSDTLSAGTYYWKVKSVDKAGNQGTFSIVRSFKTN